MTNYTITQYVQTGEKSYDRGDVLFADRYSHIEQAFECLSTVGNIIHQVPPRSFATDMLLTLEDITWNVTVELDNGSWLFYHIYDADLLGKYIPTE